MKFSTFNPFFGKNLRVLTDLKILEKGCYQTEVLMALHSELQEM